MASIENKGVRISIHTMKGSKNLPTACQLSEHLANEGSKSCSKIAPVLIGGISSIPMPTELGKKINSSFGKGL